MKSDKPKRAVALVLTVVSTLCISLLAACEGTIFPPPPTATPTPTATPMPGPPIAVKPCNGAKPCFLTKKGIGSRQESLDYYKTIDPTDAKITFRQWLSLNGFGPDGRGDVRAVYYNDHDLNLGRDMNCRMVSSAKIACYVTNYGPDPADAVGWFLQPNINKALADVTAVFNKESGHPPFATVAMEWSPYNFETNLLNNVTFYVFGPDEKRATEAILDSEGPKQVPQICLPCHGGSYSYNSNTHFASVMGASFLPFDVFHFVYSPDSKLSLSAQQESFRILNSIVRATGPNPMNPNNPIVQLIDTWYANGVDTPATVPTDKEPPGWSSNRNAYLNFVAPYCRSCHISQKDTFDFTSLQQFRSIPALIRGDVCRGHTMPHAETTFNRIWGPNVPIPGLAVLILDDPKVLPPPNPAEGDKRCQD